MLAVIALLPLIGAPADATSLIVQDFPAAEAEVPVPGPLAVGETVPPASDETLGLETDGMTSVRGTSVAVTDLAEVARSSGVGDLGPTIIFHLPGGPGDDMLELALGCAEPVSHPGTVEKSVPVAVSDDCADYIYSHKVAEDGLGYEVTACRLQEQADFSRTLTLDLIVFQIGSTKTGTYCKYDSACTGFWSWLTGGWISAAESRR